MLSWYFCAVLTDEENWREGWEGPAWRLADSAGSCYDYGMKICRGNEEKMKEIRIKYPKEQPGTDVYADYCQVFRDIDRLLSVDGTKPILVAIDGKSGSGKSTLGELIREVYDCSLFHMDDFFLQPHQRTEERFAEIGGNVDYERFYDQVLTPVLAGKNFSYRRYDCCTGKLAETIDVTASRLNIIEGVYSQHPYFGEIYDLKYFLTISDEEQKERILKRNGEFMLERFLNEWIPLENAYFEKFRIDKTVIKK